MELDERTIFFITVLINALLLGAVTVLWRQNYKRYRGLEFWAAGIVLFLISVILLVLRGSIPDEISVTFPNLLILSGLLLFLTGFQRFLGKPVAQWYNLAILAGFIVIQVFFSFFHPDLNVRTVAVNAVFYFFCVQGIWILQRGSPPEIRRSALNTTLALAVLSLVTALRLINLLLVPYPANDIFQSSVLNMVFFFFQQLAVTYLVFSLILMVNNRLNLEFRQKDSDLVTRSILLDNVNDALFLHDENGRLYYVNETASALLGYTRAELLKLNVKEISDTGGAEKAAALTREIETRGEALFEANLRRRDGTWLPLEIHDHRFIINDGIRILSTGRDIRERRAVMESLRVSEERFSRAFHSNPEAMAITLLESGVFLEINATFTQHTGFTRADAIGRSSRELNIWARIEDRVEVLDIILREGRLLNREAEFRTKSGQVRTWLTSGETIEVGGEKCIIWMNIDITDNKQALRELRASEERFRSTLDNLFEGGQIIDFDWKYTYVNSTVTRQGRKSREELIGHTMMEVYPGIENTPLFQRLRRCMQERVHDHFENEFVYGSGQSIWTELYVQPVEEGLFILSLDITNRKIAEDALRQSEENYHNLFTNMTEAFALHEIMLDSDGRPSDYRFLEVNPAFEKMTGRTSRELETKTAREAFPGLEDFWVEQYGRVALTGEAAYFEDYSGALRKWYRVYAYSPRKYYFVAQFLDITQRKKAEQALQESEEKYRTLYEEMAQGVIYQNAEGTIISMNAAARRILNVSHEQFEGTQAIDAEVQAVHEDGSDFLAADHPSMQALGSGRPVKNVVMGIRDPDDAGYRWIIINAIPQFREGESRPFQVFVTFDDITRIKEAELKLKQNEDKLRLILNSTAEAIYGVDTTGVCTFCNPSTLRMLGYAGENDLLGRKMHTVTHYQRADGSPYPLADCPISIASRAGRDSHSDQEVFWRADGTSFPVEYWSFPQLKDGRVIGTVITFIDTSERKKAEARLIEMETLRQLNKAKSELLANVSHELRTPLASIQGFIETLLEDDVVWSRAQQKDFLQSAVREVERLSFLIRDLLDMSRLDSGKMVLDKRDWSVADLLESTTNVLDILAGNHNLQYHIADGLPRIRVDRNRIGQVLTNLVENATKFSPTGSLIELSVTAGSSEVIFSVRDYGEGMSPEIQSNLFNRFFQAERVVSGKTRGTGLGLAICKGIIEAHGGAIWVTSVPAGGSTFYFSLPVPTD